METSEFSSFLYDHELHHLLQLLKIHDTFPFPISSFPDEALQQALNELDAIFQKYKDLKETKAFQSVNIISVQKTTTVQDVMENIEDSTLRFQRIVKTLEKKKGKVVQKQDKDNGEKEEIMVVKEKELVMKCCDVCLKKGCEKESLIECTMCTMKVHPKCYVISSQIETIDIMKWKCSPCQAGRQRNCVLCGYVDNGAFFRVSGKEPRYIHATCALYHPHLSLIETMQGYEIKGWVCKKEINNILFSDLYDNIYFRKGNDMESSLPTLVIFVSRIKDIKVFLCEL